MERGAGRQVPPAGQQAGVQGLQQAHRHHPDQWQEGEKKWALTALVFYSAHNPLVTLTWFYPSVFLCQISEAVLMAEYSPSMTRLSVPAAPLTATQS